jgi:RNA polymerase sigma-70 factor (ECF subfamily)
MARETRFPFGGAVDERLRKGTEETSRDSTDVPNAGELDPDPAVQFTGDLLRDDDSPAHHDAEAGLRGAPAPGFEEIVERFGRRLYALAYRLAGSTSDAEDLAQEALVRGFRGSAQFRGEADFYTYLYQILLNLWRNQLRRRRRWRMIPLWGSREGTESRPTVEPADGSPGPHERLVGREQGKKLQGALTQLDPGLRAVLVLRVSEGLEYEEIGRVLGIPIGTVRSRLARARGRIRRLMME